jgi:MFS family permease
VGGADGPGGRLRLRRHRRLQRHRRRGPGVPGHRHPGRRRRRRRAAAGRRRHWAPGRLRPAGPDPAPGRDALLLAGFAVSSAGNLLTGLAWAVAAAFALQAVRGLGIAALDVAATTLVQRIVPAGLLGRVFGTLYGGIGVAAALAYLLGGLLLDRTGPRTAFVTAGAAGLLATGATALALRRARPQAPGP